MAYVTALLCTGVLRPPLGWSPPIPIEIDSDLGTLVGADPLGLGSKYGLGTDDLEKMVNRNYCPQELSWRLIGEIGLEISIVGYQTTPGTYTTDTDEPIFDPPLITTLIIPVSHTGNLVPHEMPDFSQVERTICSMDATFTSAVNGAYPIGRDSEGTLSGAYLVVQVRVEVTLRPYSWSDAGDYLLEHDVIFTITSSLRTGPDVVFSELQPDEGVVIEMASQAKSWFPSENKLEAGQIQVSDATNGDQWGELKMWRFDTERQVLSALALRNLRHYLPITGF